MALPHRIGFLEVPNVLQPEGLLLHFIFVAHDVAHVGRRHAQRSVSYVRDQFTAFGRWGKIHRVLLLNLVVLALRWDTPGMQTCDFSIWTEIDADRAVLSSFG